MSHDEDRGGRTFCDVCCSRWRDDDRDNHMVGIAKPRGGPGDNVQFVKVDDPEVKVHVCKYCLRQVANLAHKSTPDKEDCNSRSVLLYSALVKEISAAAESEEIAGGTLVWIIERIRRFDEESECASV